MANNSTILLSADDIRLCNEINKAYYTALLYCKTNNIIEEPVTLLVYNEDVVNLVHGTGYHLDPGPYLSIGLPTKVYKWFLDSHQITDPSDMLSNDYIDSGRTTNSHIFQTYLAKENKSLPKTHPRRTKYLPDYKFDRILSWFKPKSEEELNHILSTLSK